MTRQSHALPALTAAWDTYYKAIETARLMMEDTPRFRDFPDTRATMYYSLAEAQAMAYNLAIAPRMDVPMVHTHGWYHYYFTLGGTSPDFYNVFLYLDGRRTYRLKGRMGDLELLVLQGYTHLLGHAESKLLGNFDIGEMKHGANRTFDVIISANKHAGNWIPMDANSDYNFFFARRVAHDWYKDMGELDVEMIDGPVASTDTDEQVMAKRVLLARDILMYLVKTWNIDIHDHYRAACGGEWNQVAIVPGGDMAEDFMGSPSTVYGLGVFKLKDHEALIIEFDVPNAGYWSVQLHDVWCKPMDFINYQTDVNMSRVAIDGDGKWRAVIALSDPGISNWLNPVGRHEGNIVFRAYHSRALPAKPVTRLVNAAELKKEMPADTKWVTAAERKAQLTYRRKGWLGMYGE
jgi:hypothetical protein